MSNKKSILPRPVLRCLKTNNLQHLNFYLRAIKFLTFGELGQIANITMNTNLFYSQAQPIKDTINENIPIRLSQINLDDLSSTLELLAEKNILLSNHFNWLKNDSEACLFVWLKIKNNHRSLRGLHLETDARYQTYKSPSSAAECLKNIMDFFDFTFLSPTSYKSKNDHLNDLKDEWLKARKKTKIPKWLDVKNDDVISWARQYIIDYNENKEQKNTRLYQHELIPFVDQFIKNDQNYALIAALLHWNPNPDTKTLFFQRMNRAWSQRKSRHSRTDTKAINTYVSIDAKEKLDKLAKLNRVRMNEMLEILIEDQYEKQREEINYKYKH